MSTNECYFNALTTDWNTDCSGSSITVHIANVTANAADEEFLAQWRSLLSTSHSQEKIYQSPEYFFFLKKTVKQEDLHVFAVRDTQTNKCVGIVPVRLIDQALPFGIGSKTLAAPSVRTILLLGSIALIPQKPEVLEQLAATLFAHFRECSAIAMQSVPKHSLAGSNGDINDALQKGSYAYVLHGWRQCHTIPLPDTFEQYLKQLSAKKRYNLSRQVKMLEKQAGPVQLHRIDTPAQIPMLIDALAAVVPAEKAGQFTSGRSYAALAAQGLLHGYVLKAGERYMGVIVAKRYDKVLHLHNIFHVNELPACSIGTSILFMAIEDLTKNFSIHHIDLGYGVPAYRHESTNVIMDRGHVLLLRKSIKNLLLIRMHQGFTQISELAKRVLSRHGHDKLASLLPRLKFATLTRREVAKANTES